MTIGKIEDVSVSAFVAVVADVISVDCGTMVPGLKSPLDEGSTKVAVDVDIGAMVLVGDAKVEVEG